MNLQSWPERHQYSPAFSYHSVFFLFLTVIGGGVVSWSPASPFIPAAHLKDIYHQVGDLSIIRWITSLLCHQVTFVLGKGFREMHWQKQVLGHIKKLFI